MHAVPGQAKLSVPVVWRVNGAARGNAHVHIANVFDKMSQTLNRISLFPVRSMTHRSSPHR